MRAAALNGLGVGLMPSWLFDEALAQGRVVRLLANWCVPPLPISALYPAKRLLPRRASVFMDFLSMAFAADASLLA